MAKTPFELKGKTVCVAGHRGMVGGALVRRLAQEGVELLTIGRREVDLRRLVEQRGVKVDSVVAELATEVAITATPVIQYGKRKYARITWI